MILLNQIGIHILEHVETNQSPLGVDSKFLVQERAGVREYIHVYTHKYNPTYDHKTTKVKRTVLNAFERIVLMHSFVCCDHVCLFPEVQRSRG